MTSDPGIPDEPDVRPAPPAPTSADTAVMPARHPVASAWMPDGQSTAPLGTAAPFGATPFPGADGEGSTVPVPAVTYGGVTYGDVTYGAHGMPAAGPVHHRRHPWPVIVLGLLLAVLLAASTYLVVLARSLEQRNAEWEEVARGTGQELAQSREELEGALAELEGTREQLGAAQTRITELADEKAQLGDDREVQQRLVDYQQRVSEAARDVASALATCIDGQYRLIEYLQNASQYDPTDLARFRTDVQRVCGAATDANTTLQQELDR